MDPKLIQDLKNAWRNTNTATVGFLQNIPTENIGDKPFEKRFTNYSWEFACLVRTRLCYLDELKTGVQNFADRDDIPNKEEIINYSKAKMLDTLSETSNHLINELETLSEYMKVGRIIWLLQHERIHQGKLMLYHAKSGFEIPESFKKTWGESNF